MVGKGGYDTRKLECTGAAGIEAEFISKCRRRTDTLTLMNINSKVNGIRGDAGEMAERRKHTIQAYQNADREQ